jgi:hypothetical protein
MNVFLTVHPLPDQPYCCCVSKAISPKLNKLLTWQIFKLFPCEDEELLRAYRILDRYMPCNMAILEYDEEFDDIISMFHCYELLKTFKLEHSTLKGKFLKRDLGVPEWVGPLNICTNE